MMHTEAQITLVIQRLTAAIHTLGVVDGVVLGPIQATFFHPVLGVSMEWPLDELLTDVNALLMLLESLSCPSQDDHEPVPTQLSLVPEWSPDNDPDTY